MVDFMDDKQLLGELKRGNNAAFEFLFKSYYPRSIDEKYRVEYLAKVDGEARLYYADFMQDAEHKLLYKELQEQIALVLNQLPDRSREIFLLSRFRGLKNREIAEKLQISTTAVEKHIARALQYFSRHFSERYPVDLYIVILAWLMMEQK